MSEKIVLWSEDQPLSLSLVPQGGPTLSVRAAGSSFHQPFLRSLHGRVSPGRDLLAWLWPEPENPFHGRAIRFMAAEPLTRLTGQAGYLPREVAERWFPFVRGFQFETGSLPAFPAHFTSPAPGSPRKGLEFVAPAPNEWMESLRVAA